MLSDSVALTEAVYYILISLYSQLHGYGIMQNVESISKGRVKLAAGTLYGALSTMLEKGWIHALPGEDSRRKKEYIITPEGKKMVENEVARLRELIVNGDRVIEKMDVETIVLLKHI